ncbi:mechanosensitive ion channel family protein [Sorangium atrum]|uniref:Mechanosensitive ion channel n=1 Tax=Sorangium atrum TaxID=2995308 RepID=A0ABT5BWA9_9BACT|nr:mechanosensitive ion channel domain-containing protein [Sorangium aterium]MDC0677256.1 mechanosensitive ion channel [Sorangium aterium]
MQNSNFESLGARLGIPGDGVWPWVIVAASVPVGFGLARIAAGVFRRGGSVVARRTATPWDEKTLDAAIGPVTLCLGVVLTAGLAKLTRIGQGLVTDLRSLLSALFIGGVAWLLMRIVGILTEVLDARAVRHLKEGSESSRGLRTQARVLERVARVLIVIVAGALVLMNFEAVRNVGVSLLASAGIAGVVLGLAAQKPVGAILSGLHILFTRPIDLGDKVVVDGEFGTIEEIRLTHVVVKIWDERRLIVPTARLLDQSFQNWTKHGSEKLGTVELYVDYRTPVDALRRHFESILPSSELWDKRVKAVQVTNVTERTIEVRLLVSARDPGQLFDLRCWLREEMLRWVQELESGAYLPQERLTRTSSVMEAAEGRAPASGRTRRAGAGDRLPDAAP